MRWTVALLAGSVALNGCTAGQDYKMPALDMPERWHALWAKDAKPVELSKPWWKALHDETLDGLMSRALMKNQDRQMAQARILEARGVRQNAASGLYPQVAAVGQASRGDLGLQTFNKTQTLYDAHFDASYEFDLFGGVSRKVEAQDASIQAWQANLRDVTLTLTAEVAREYIAWRQWQQQAQLSQSIIAAQAQRFAIVQAQHKAGVASDVDVSQAETALKATEASLPGIQRQLAATGYALSVLLGENPGALNEELKEVKPLPVPATVAVLESPAEIIARRPDVQRAERELAGATALQGAAVSDLYPKITLSALLGVQDTSLSGGGTVWSLGSGIAAPLLNFGRIEGQIKAADARQMMALYTYQQTALKALAEVETALSNVEKENQRRLALQASADSAEQTLAMMQNRYKQGLNDLSEVLQAEEKSNQAKSDAVGSQAELLNDLVALYKAVGAQEVPDAASNAPSIN